MTFEPGAVVTLKSGGHPMTVVAVSETDIDCVWMGEEGEFFRETIPAAALIGVASDEDEEDKNGDDEDEEDEHAGGGAKRKRKVA
jgi:uncharacterized protein YodC (DUF2158 family)